eukprot:CAMPEP_0119121846 /NCGR_PEP_ID=MMETSP1310-20130426/2284_1 /TAXON_ID=464262 /ORGANISM="Genus nov. species nov., Strain RCC2339" /LENGTH=885 /DNA_ID=CAMNT_0007111427 /DNA_START=147 /DNA_END=2804 /DNA_ORIENTATION=-
MAGGRIEKRDEDDVEVAPFQNLEKGIVLQETRIFGATPVNVKKCCHLLTKVLVLVARGDQLTTKEATDVFFSITKLFQSKDLFLRRLLYLTLKELTPLAEDVIIVISSLTKDMNSPIELYRAHAIRVLCNILTDISLLGQGERHLKQAIMDREAVVSSAALVSGIHLLKHAPNVELVKRWVNEISEASKSRDQMVQYHSLGLLYTLKKHDPLAVIKLLTTVRKNVVRSPFANCLLVRYTIRLLRENPPGEDLTGFYEYLGACLRNTNDMVMYEVARSLVVYDLPGVPYKLISSAFSVLQLFLTTPKSILRFAAIRTLSEVADRYPREVQEVNSEIDNLIGDSNRTIATLAITTLLKTGDASSVDGLLAEILSFMGEISEEFKVVLIKAVRSLCSKYPQKYRTVLGFLSDILREEGGFAYKKAILDTILEIMRDVPDAREIALSCVCEFIEDCEYYQLSILVLNVIGREGPATSCPSRYVRYIYNRIILENSMIRASAVQALAEFGLRLPELRQSVLNLLERILLDTDDEVRDRATFYVQLIRDEEGLPAADLLADLPITPEELEASLLDYQGTACDHPFDLDTAISMAISERPARAALEKRDQERDHFAPLAGTSSALESQVAAVPEFAQYGKVFKSCPPWRLTEDTVEYTVSCVKHIFAQHVVFEFIVCNTVSEQELEDVTVTMEAVDDGDTDLLEILVPDVAVDVKLLKYDQPASCFVSFSREAGDFPLGTFLTTLKFTAFNLDSAGVREDEEGDEDEYPIDDIEILTADYTVKASIGNFQEAWEAHAENESVEIFALSSAKNLQDAVNEILKILCLQPVDGSEEVPAKKSKHILYATGVWVTGALVLARARMRLNNQTRAVDLELCIRSPDESIIDLVASAM